MDRATTGASRLTPTLADYGRAIWRRRLVVLVAMLVGALFGAFVGPKIVPAPTYTATLRVEVNPLNSAILYGQGATSGLSKTNAPNAFSSTPYNPLQNAAAVQAVLNDLGHDAHKLTALANLKPFEYAGGLANAITSFPVSGTNYVDISFTDPNARLASAVVTDYANALTSQRNSIDSALVNKGMATLEKQVTAQAAIVKALGLAAASEATSTTGRTQPSPYTQNQLQIATQHYQSLLTNLDAIRNHLAFAAPSTAVEGPPLLTPGSTRVGRSILLPVGLLLGLIIGIGIALVMEGVRPKLLTATDAEVATGMSVIGAVPRRGIGRRCQLPVLDKPFTPAAEGVRALAGTLERHGLGRTVNALAVLSAENAQGKTLLSLNLAHALALQGHAVTLISSDLRRPRLQRLVAAELPRRLDGVDTETARLIGARLDDSAPGLADFLAGGETDPESLLVPIAQNLRLMPTGQVTQHPAALLVPERLERLRKGLALRGTDIVLFDTPPALWAAEALAIAGAADSSVVVIRAGAAHYPAVQALADNLRRDGLPTIGLVLTATKTGLPNRVGRDGYGYDFKAAEGTTAAAALGSRSNNGKAEQPAREELV